MSVTDTARWALLMQIEMTYNSFNSIMTLPRLLTIVTLAAVTHFPGCIQALESFPKTYHDGNNNMQSSTNLFSFDRSGQVRW